VGADVTVAITCTVDVASVVAAGGWQAARMIIAIIAIARKIKVFLIMSPFQYAVKNHFSFNNIFINLLSFVY
ncbi:MAG: hypothetical protein ABFD50_23655, partial [Smithella sp.]